MYEKTCNINSKALDNAADVLKAIAKSIDIYRNTDDEIRKLVFPIIKFLNDVLHPIVEEKEGDGLNAKLLP